MIYLKESLEDNEESETARPLTDVLQSLSDEVAGYLMMNYRGHSRELSMILAKLDEARLWAVSHGSKIGTHAIVDKRRLINPAPRPEPVTNA